MINLYIKAMQMTTQKKILFCLMLLLQAWPSYADNISRNDFFLHLDTGLSSSRNMRGAYQTNADNSIIFGAGIKYQLLPKIKIGASFAYKPGHNYAKSYNNVSNIDYKVHATQKFNIVSYMINASYDIIEIGDKLTPYAEIGIGVSYIKFKNFMLDVYKKDRPENRMYKNIRSMTSSGKTFTAFTMSAGVGLVYKMNNNMDVDINYKYNDFGKINYVRKSCNTRYLRQARIRTDEFLLSFRFKM